MHQLSKNTEPRRPSTNHLSRSSYKITHKLNKKRSLNEKIGQVEHSGFEQTDKEWKIGKSGQELSCEQKAYASLIEESYNHDRLDLIMSKEPDAFLRITPRLDQHHKKVQKQQNDARQQLNLTNFIRNKFSPYISKSLTQSPNKQQQPHCSSTIKQSVQPSSTSASLQKQNPEHRQKSSNKNNISNINTNTNTNNANYEYFSSKQVLSVTQYMVAGSGWAHGFNCLETSNKRKLERSKYIRVLRQMRNRNVKKKIDTQPYFVRSVTQDISSSHIIRQMPQEKINFGSFFATATDNSDINRMYMSSQRTRNSKTMRTTAGRSLQEKRTHTNRIF